MSETKTISGNITQRVQLEFSNETSILISSTHFISIASTENGGALQVHAFSSDLQIQDSIFENCSTTYLGGAYYTQTNNTLSNRVCISGSLGRAYQALFSSVKSTNIMDLVTVTRTNEKLEEGHSTVMNVFFGNPMTINKMNFTGNYGTSDDSSVIGPIVTINGPFAMKYSTFAHCDGGSIFDQQGGSSTTPYITFANFHHINNTEGNELIRYSMEIMFQYCRFKDNGPAPLIGTSMNGIVIFEDCKFDVSPPTVIFEGDLDQFNRKVKLYDGYFLNTAMCYGEQDDEPKKPLEGWKIAVIVIACIIFVIIVITLIIYLSKCMCHCCCNDESAVQPV